MTLPLSVTDPGIQAVLTAFQNANETTRAVRSGVTAAQSGMRWSGDASTTYRNSLNNWLDGLTKVEAGLNAMNQAMEEHRTATNNAEGHNTGSSNWYR
jgi:uncharacterized protein YukE